MTACDISLVLRAQAGTRLCKPRDITSRSFAVSQARRVAIRAIDIDIDIDVSAYIYV